MISPWYAIAYIKLDRIAMRHGYALALHGSMMRDLDLVAVPWTSDADEPAKLLESICAFIIAKTGKKVYYPMPRAENKPHGRLAYAFPIGHDGNYLDLSIMPFGAGEQTQAMADLEDENKRLTLALEEANLFLKKIQEGEPIDLDALRKQLKEDWDVLYGEGANHAV